MVASTPPSPITDPNSPLPKEAMVLSTVAELSDLSLIPSADVFDEGLFTAAVDPLDTEGGMQLFDGG